MALLEIIAVAILALPLVGIAALFLASVIQAIYQAIKYRDFGAAAWAAALLYICVMVWAVVYLEQARPA